MPVLVSAWRSGRSRERKIVRRIAIGIGALVAVAAAGAVVAAIAAQPNLSSATKGSERGLDLLRDGDTAAAADAFSLAQHAFESAHNELSGILSLPGRFVPVLAQHVNALERVSAAGERLDFTASQAAGSADWRSLTANGGQVDLEKVRAMQAPVAASSAAIDEAIATVADVRSPWLVAPVNHELNRLETKLDATAEEARTASEGLAVAPALLGGNGTRRYFVAFATPGESRDGGGFAGAFGVVSADAGRLTVDRTGASVRDLDPPRGEGYHLDYPPGWLERYGTYHLNLFSGNLTASPDWPTDADLARQLYPQTRGGGPVDGVVYADPAAMAALLELTGPVTVPGIDEQITTANVEHYLLVDQYVQFAAAYTERTEFLGNVARAVFEALTSRPLPGIRQLSEVLGPAVAGGHLRLATFGSADEQAFLDRVGISGKWRTTPGADYLSLRSANTLPNKIDVYLHRTMTVDAAYDPSSGQVNSTVTVQLRNDAPASGLPPYLIGNDRRLPFGTNRDLLALYSPLDVQSVSVDGTPTGVQNQIEFGGHVYSVPVDIPPGETVTVTYLLQGTIAPGPTYRLDVLKQALANDDEVSVSVSASQLTTKSGQLPASESGPLVENRHVVVVVGQAVR
jgi:hypothetical protein